MREILFRGKRVDNGEWVYGFYANIPEHHIDKLSGKDFIVSINNGLLMEVIPETVGQFTGLTDKNGTKIFEGDIVKEWSCWHKNLSATVLDIECYLVACDYLGSLYLKKNTSCGEVRIPLMRISTVEVIGNIYDNFELLEVEE